ncbi:hypothetical protein LTS18_004369 [Coniosporium uncinatum]|uniref:Uncharacterized protein n=1 Tax=Coniosporium uncinatum TaxID=93489 RepID=A0ACC3DBL0_9PEZI|nr:hypothetical protein LTS18_004369 [Coniosporium uncinatum]
MDAALTPPASPYRRPISLSAQPRPYWVITSANGDTVPLVPVDELPLHIQQEIYPLSSELGETRRMVLLGQFADPENDEPACSSSHRNRGFPQTQRSFRAPDAAIRQILNLQTAQSNSMISAPSSPLPIRPSGPPLSMAGSWRRSQQAQVDETQALVDRIAASEHQIAGTISHSGPRRLPPSGVVPDSSKKEYCTFWLRTGECNYMQQGCLYKHEMPDGAKLRELGFNTAPRWWSDKHAIRVQPLLRDGERMSWLESFTSKRKSVSSASSVQSELTHAAGSVTDAEKSPIKPDIDASRNTGSKSVASTVSTPIATPKRRSSRTERPRMLYASKAELSATLRPRLPYTQQAQPTVLKKAGSATDTPVPAPFQDLLIDATDLEPNLTKVLPPTPSITAITPLLSPTPAPSSVTCSEPSNLTTAAAKPPASPRLIFVPAGETPPRRSPSSRMVLPMSRTSPPKSIPILISTAPATERPQQPVAQFTPGQALLKPPTRAAIEAHQRTQTLPPTSPPTSTMTVDQNSPTDLLCFTPPPSPPRPAAPKAVVVVNLPPPPPSAAPQKPSTAPSAKAADIIITTTAHAHAKKKLATTSVTPRRRGDAKPPRGALGLASSRSAGQASSPPRIPRGMPSLPSPAAVGKEGAEVEKGAVREGKEIMRAGN